MLTLVISVLAAGPSFGLCTPEPADLSRAAAQLRADLDVPGLAIAAADEDGLIAWGVAGVRAADGDDPIRRDDRFHVGSLTKAMTATLAARLVERGLLRWDSTVQEVSPVVAAGLPEHARDRARRVWTRTSLIPAGTSGRPRASHHCRRCSARTTRRSWDPPGGRTCP